MQSVFILLFSVHPRDKQDVAYRLVQSSLAVAYDQSVVYQGPFPVHLTTEDWAFGAKVKIIYNSPVEERNFEGFEVHIFGIILS